MTGVGEAPSRLMLCHGHRGCELLQNPHLAQRPWLEAPLVGLVAAPVPLRIHVPATQDSRRADAEVGPTLAFHVLMWPGLCTPSSTWHGVGVVAL